MVGSKKNINEPIVVEVSRTNAGTIVKIHVLKKVEGIGRIELVCKIEAGAITLQHRKCVRSLFLFLARKQYTQ